MQRLRDLILSLFILGSIVVVILLIITFFNTKRTIEIHENPSALKKLNSLKSQLVLLEDNECTKFINSYVKELEKGNFNGKIKSKDIINYINTTSPFGIFNNAKELCKATDQTIEFHNFSGKITTMMVLNTNILNPYSYEMRIKDSSNDITYNSLVSLSYNGLRTIQVEILEDLVNIAKEMEGTHE